MERLRSPRTIALIALVITAAAVLYAAGSALTHGEPSLGWLIQSVIHVGELLTVVALARSDAAGPGRAAKLGIGTAIVGQVILAGAELIWPSLPGLGDALFSIGPLLTGVGLLVAGVLVVRTRRWTGWHRWTPVAVGAYVLAVLIPVLIGSGGPPAPVAVWAIAGWDALWALTAISALTASNRSRPRQPRIEATVG